MNNQNELIDNKERNRFELKTEDKTAFIDYIINKNGMIFLTHTEVPVGLEGKGIASEMVLQALKIIEERELKLVPICPFVTSYVMRHPEWKKLLDENHRM
ncbi:MAG: N-acetyltransferase [Balneolaceae bacterium]|nr:MAG: N-acetyltransferase [Balneolaceae bacterium]